MENALASFAKDLDKLRKFFFAEHDFDKIELKYIKRPGYNDVIDSFKNKVLKMEVSAIVNYKDNSLTYECYYQPNPKDIFNIEQQIFHSTDDVIEWVNSKF